MQRSLKLVPSETWYYYTFYNSYDDEQREYRYERHTKQVERMQSKSRCEERHILSKHDSPLIYCNPRNINDMTVTNMKRTETLEVDDTFSSEKQKEHKCEVSPIPMPYLIRRLTVREYAVQLVENTKKILNQANGSNFNILSVAMYSSLQYEKLMKIITLPNVVTGMLICDLILLVLILY